MIFIVTAAHNRREVTRAYLTDLLAQTDQDYQLVLVDDGSTDGTAEMVLEKMPNAIVLKGNGRLYWAGGLHKAYRYLKKGILSREDIVFISNDDIRLPADFLETGRRLVEEHPDRLVSALRYLPERPEKPGNPVFLRDPVTAKGRRCEPGEPGNVTSTKALFMTAEAYLTIGGMHPFLIPHYCSDDEYTLRAARKGYPSICDEALLFTGKDSTFTAEMKTRSKKKTLGEHFRKTSSTNPFYRMNYVLLSTPPRLLPKYIAYKLFHRDRS